MTFLNPVVAQTFLLAADPGYRYCLLRAPSAGIPLRGAIVVAAPLAEELNRSRRMIALGAERLAGEGFAVLEIDYRGCGDSSDDFGDARWDDWIDDLARGLEWVSTRYHAPAWLWGVRGGALLAATVIDRLEAAPSLLLWQPVTSGRQHLTQWLRLKIAADMLGESAGRASTAQLRAQLDSGEQVEIAGYTIHPALASGLDGAKLAPRRAVPRASWRSKPAPATTHAIACARRVRGRLARVGRARRHARDRWRGVLADGGDRRRPRARRRNGRRHARQQRMTPREEPFLFDCEGERLVGSSRMPTAAPNRRADRRRRSAVPDRQSPSVRAARARARKRRLPRDALRLPRHGRRHG